MYDNEDELSDVDIKDVESGSEDIILYDDINYKVNEFGGDIDPDEHLFNNIIKDCDYYTDNQFKCFYTNGAFSIIHFNSRSLNKNYNDIKQYLSQFSKFSVIAVSETWLEADKCCEVELDGYDLFTTNRINKRGGGVALYINTDLGFMKINSESTTIDDVLECISCEIILEKSKNIVVSCVYRTPGSSLDIFNKKMDSLFNNPNKVHIVCGDFNIDLLNPQKNVKITDFINIMYSTRITSDTSTLIDNIFTNQLASQITAGVLINDITDHFPIFSVFKELRNNTTKTNDFKVVRHRTPEAIAAFRDDLCSQTWHEVYTTTDPDRAYNAFLLTLTQLYDQHCPHKKYFIKNKNSQDKPWLTKGIIRACKRKQQLYRVYLKKRTKQNEERYKRYKNKLIQIIRFNRKMYYCNLLEHYKTDIQGTWRVLNGIIRNGKKKEEYPNHFIVNNTTISEKNEIANAFNNFFVNVGPKLANEIVQSNNAKEFKEIHIKNNLNSLFIESVSEREIMNIVLSFKTKKTTDESDIDMVLVKDIIDCIVSPLTYICNQSFSTGIFPSKMKTAKVIPIFKNGDKQQFTNYRPISILSQFSKILEKLFVKRLDDFIAKHNLLSEHQYGFRPNRSTSMAVTELVEQLSTSIENSEYAVGVFIDLSKAFDTIDHSLLLNKLEKYGVRGVAHTWLKSYLSDRNQYVHINGIRSLEAKITHGVPQGSVLGPKLFILYINDICEVLDKLQCILFADDTSLYASGKDLQLLLNSVETELESLRKWFEANKLSLNLKKTKYIVIGNKVANKLCRLKIGEVEIERVYVIKFLGINIDDRLNWKVHINILKNKISKVIAILCKIKTSVNQKALYILYNSLIFPYLSYCVEIWGNTYKTIIQPIFLLQKKAIRVIRKLLE